MDFDRHRVLKIRARRFFDASKQEDRQAFAGFLQDLKWGTSGCPFILEDNWSDIPTMLAFKVSRHSLSV